MRRVWCSSDIGQCPEPLSLTHRPGLLTRLQAWLLGYAPFLCKKLLTVKPCVQLGEELTGAGGYASECFCSIQGRCSDCTTAAARAGPLRGLRWPERACHLQRGPLPMPISQWAKQRLRQQSWFGVAGSCTNIFILLHGAHGGHMSPHV